MQNKPASAPWQQSNWKQEKKKSEQSKAGIWKHGRFIPKLIL